MTTTTQNMTRELATVLADVDARELPDDVVDAARRALLDHLACGIHGSQFPWTRMVVDDVMTNSAPGASVLYGRTERMCAPAAARVNGTAAHGFELDDLYQPGMVHPGSVVVPAAFAVGTAAEVELRRVVEGIVVGYEVLARTTTAIGLWHNSQGFHATGVFGALGASAAAAAVRSFDAERLEQTLGVAASLGGGIKAFQAGGGMIKRLHAGRAAESGVLAADLAGRGFTGPHDVFNVTRGIVDVFGGDDARPERLTAGLGGRFAIQDIYVKPYASCAMTHTAIEATQSLMTSTGIAAEDVVGVRLGTCRRGVEQNSGLTIHDTMSAQYSLEYALALALRGEADDPVHFLPEHVAAPSRRRLMDLVRVEVDDDMEAAYPHYLGCRVAVETKQAVHEVELLESDAQRDAQQAWLLLERKARTLIGQVLDDSRALQIIQTVRGLGLDAPVPALAALVASR